MTQRELYRKLAKETGITQTKAKKAMIGLAKGIKDLLEGGYEALLPGFGTFYVSKKGKVKFRASKGLIELINSGIQNGNKKEDKTEEKTTVIFPELLDKILKFEQVSKGHYFFPIYNFTFCPCCRDIKRVEYYNNRLDEDEIGCNMMRFPDCGHDFPQSEDKPVVQFPSEMQEKLHKMEEPGQQLEIFKQILTNMLSLEIENHEKKIKNLEELIDRAKRIRFKRERE